MGRAGAAGDGLIGDLITFCTDEMPLWYPVSISGYHMRERVGAVLSGAQSVHTAAYDETLSIPTAESATLALRTQRGERRIVGVNAHPRRRVSTALDAIATFTTSGNGYFIEQATRPQTIATPCWIPPRPGGLAARPRHGQLREDLPRLSSAGSPPAISPGSRSSTTSRCAG